MFWVWFMGGCVLMLVGGLFAGGALLPRDHVATGSIKVASAPLEIWQTIRNVGNHPSWRKGVTRVEILEGDPLAPTTWIEYRGRDQLKLHLEAADAPRRCVTRIADENLPFGGTWTIELTEENGQTRVRVTEHGFVKLPPFRVIARFLIGYSRTLQDYLRELAVHHNSDPHIEA